MVEKIKALELVLERPRDEFDFLRTGMNSIIQVRNKSSLGTPHNKIPVRLPVHRQDIECQAGHRRAQSEHSPAQPGAPARVG